MSNIKSEVTCPIEFLKLMLFLDLPNGILYSIVERELCLFLVTRVGALCQMFQDTVPFITVSLHKMLF